METKHTLSSSRRRTGSLHPLLTAGCGCTWNTQHNNVEEWCNDDSLLLLLIKLLSRIEKYLCVRQFTLIPLHFPEVILPIQEVINNRSSRRSLTSLVWLTSRRALIWSYLHCSERWQPVAWGIVFCFHGRSQVCRGLPDETTIQQWYTAMCQPEPRLWCSQLHRVWTMGAAGLGHIEIKSVVFLWAIDVFLCGSSWIDRHSLYTT